MGHEKNCEDDSCCKEHSSVDMAGMMMKLSEEAWSELMKEKMKAHLEKVNGTTMDKVASTTVAASMEYWKSKMEAMSKCKEHSHKIMSAFME